MSTLDTVLENMQTVGEQMQKGSMINVLIDPNSGMQQGWIKEQREKCAKLLDEEAQRGRDLLNLCDDGGSPFFDPATVQACIEAIEYCAARIRAGDEPKEPR